jgi:hypothetical protein
MAASMSDWLALVSPSMMIVLKKLVSPSPCRERIALLGVSRRRYVTRRGDVPSRELWGERS